MRILLEPLAEPLALVPRCQQPPSHGEHSLSATVNTALGGRLQGGWWH